MKRASDDLNDTIYYEKILKEQINKLQGREPKSFTEAELSSIDEAIASVLIRESSDSRELSLLNANEQRKFYQARLKDCIKKTNEIVINKLEKKPLDQEIVILYNFVVCYGLNKTLESILKINNFLEKFQEESKEILSQDIEQAKNTIYLNTYRLAKVIAEQTIVNFNESKDSEVLNNRYKNNIAIAFAHDAKSLIIIEKPNVNLKYSDEGWSLENRINDENLCKDIKDIKDFTVNSRDLIFFSFFQKELSNSQKLPQSSIDKIKASEISKEHKKLILSSTSIRVAIAGVDNAKVCRKKFLIPTLLEKHDFKIIEDLTKEGLIDINTYESHRGLSEKPVLDEFIMTCISASEIPYKPKDWDKKIEYIVNHSNICKGKLAQETKARISQLIEKALDETKVGHPKASGAFLFDLGALFARTMDNKINNKSKKLIYGITIGGAVIGGSLAGVGILENNFALSSKVSSSILSDGLKFFGKNLTIAITAITAGICFIGAISYAIKTRDNKQHNFEGRIRE